MMTSAIPPQNREFSTAMIERMLQAADARGNYDGSVSKAELDAFEKSQRITDYRALTPDEIMKQDALSVLKTNFNAIANRASKKDEAVTLEWRSTDSTIERSEIRKLAGFDGDATNITFDDVSLLAGGNTVNWPREQYRPPVPPTLPGIPPQFQQLLQLLLLLLLSGLFRR